MTAAEMQTLVGRRFRYAARPTTELADGVWRIAEVRADSRFPIRATHADGYIHDFGLVGIVALVDAYESEGLPSPAMAARLADALHRQAAAHGVAMTREQSRAIASNLAYAVADPEPQEPR